MVEQWLTLRVYIEEVATLEPTLSLRVSVRLLTILLWMQLSFELIQVVAMLWQVIQLETQFAGAKMRRRNLLL